jgi:hypothetical protein
MNDLNEMILRVLCSGTVSDSALDAIKGSIHGREDPRIHSEGYRQYTTPKNF